MKKAAEMLLVLFCLSMVIAFGQWVIKNETRAKVPQFTIKIPYEYHQDAWILELLKRHTPSDDYLGCRITESMVAEYQSALKKESTAFPWEERVYVVHFGGFVTDYDVIGQLYQMGLEPARLRHLLALAIQYPEEVKKYHEIVALNSEIGNSGAIPHIINEGRDRDTYLYPFVLYQTQSLWCNSFVGKREIMCCHEHCERGGVAVIAVSRLTD